VATAVSSLELEPHGLEVPVLAHEPVDDGLHLVALLAFAGVAQHGGNSSRSSSLWCSKTAPEETHGLGSDLACLHRRCEQGGQRVEFLQVGNDAGVAFRKTFDGIGFDVVVDRAHGVLLGMVGVVGATLRSLLKQAKAYVTRGARV
jgi:hypothetical protein